MQLSVGSRITVSGTEYELACRCKCAGIRGWMAYPCNADGMPDTRHERWIDDTEITGVLDKKTRQYELSIAETASNFA